MALTWNPACARPNHRRLSISLARCLYAEHAFFLSCPACRSFATHTCALALPVWSRMARCVQGDLCAALLRFVWSRAQVFGNCCTPLYVMRFPLLWCLSVAVLFFDYRLPLLRCQRIFLRVNCSRANEMFLFIPFSETGNRADAGASSE
jgi:hypothetical protein